MRSGRADTHISQVLKPKLNSANAILFSETLDSLSDNSHAGYGVLSGGAGGRHGEGAVGEVECLSNNSNLAIYLVQSVHWLGRRSESVCCVEYTISFLSMVSLLAGMKVKANRLSLVLLFLYSMSSLLVRVETRASVLCIVLPTY